MNTDYILIGDKKYKINDALIDALMGYFMKILILQNNMGILMIGLIRRLNM